MSVRRNTKNRLNLYRTCAICGRSFYTTADTPWMRQMPLNGKKQATAYFCSASCKQASYKHLFDGKAEERKRERDAKRDTKEKNRRYYAKHAEELRERRRQQYWADPEGERADNKYYKEKRKLRLAEEAP